jgi:hypothetical protein
MDLPVTSRKGDPFILLRELEGMQYDRWRAQVTESTRSESRDLQKEEIRCHPKKSSKAELRL